MRYFETGATRDSDENKFDYEGFLNPFVLEVFAAYMHRNRVQADGKLRDSDNWQKGMPAQQYMKSLTRHFMELWRTRRGDSKDVEGQLEALCAMLFNVQGMMLELLKERDCVQDIKGQSAANVLNRRIRGTAAQDDANQLITAIRERTTTHPTDKRRGDDHPSQAPYTGPGDLDTDRVLERGTKAPGEAVSPDDFSRLRTAQGDGDGRPLGPWYADNGEVIRPEDSDNLRWDTLDLERKQDAVRRSEGDFPTNRGGGAIPIGIGKEKAILWNILSGHTDSCTCRTCRGDY